MTDKHTPGPWAVLVERGDDHFVIPSWDDESAICRVNGHGPETKANARLISATPDLLVAAEILASLDTGNGRIFPTPEQCEVARAAVAKARGVKS